MFEQVKNKVKNILNRTRNSHDWEHTERVYNLCMHIGEKEKADTGILQYAAILHDIGRKNDHQSKGKKCHAEIGAKNAGKILKKFKMNEDKIKKIIHCIETHRFRGDKKPQSLEAKVLFDADKLDSIGAIGIGRAFLFAGEIGARVHNKDIEVEKTKSYTREDTAYREFLVKMRYLKDRMLTKTGKKIAKGRHEFMVNFFDRINKEVSGKDV